jgi:hypothetical protein
MQMSEIRQQSPMVCTFCLASGIIELKLRQPRPLSDRRQNNHTYLPTKNRRYTMNASRFVSRQHMFSELTSLDQAGG